MLSAAVKMLAVIGLLIGLIACSEAGESMSTQNTQAASTSGSQAESNNLETAIFAAGCFWCVEEAFDKAEGVKVTTSGYTDGRVENPTYDQVSAGGTGHTEGVLVKYDPDQISYEELLKVFWLNVDATDAGGQFCDRGSQYRSGIYYTSEAQKQAAEASRQALQNDPDAPSPIVTEIKAASEFYPAEEYHQNYYQKNPIRYKFYKTSCGREGRLDELWGEDGEKVAFLQ